MMITWYVTVALLVVLCIVVTALCFSPRFNYRWRHSLEPFVQRKRMKELERRMAIEREKMSQAVHAAYLERQAEQQRRNAEARSNSTRRVQRQWQDMEAQLEHMRKAAEQSHPSTP